MTSAHTRRSEPVHAQGWVQTGAGHTQGLCGAHMWVNPSKTAEPVTCWECISVIVANSGPDSEALDPERPRPAKTVGGDCHDPATKPCADHPWRCDTTGNAWCEGCGALTQLAPAAACQIDSGIAEPFGHPAGSGTPEQTPSEPYPVEPAPIGAPRPVTWNPPYGGWRPSGATGPERAA